MKKIIALVCSIFMIVSMFTIATNAAVDGVTATLEFKEYQAVGTATFALVDLKVSIPDTLTPYVVTEPDYIESEVYTFSGKAVQGFGFEIPYVDGLTFNKAKCTTPIGATITADSTNKMAKITMANTAGYEGYFSGDLTTIATLWYKVSDTTATYSLLPTKATVKLYCWDNAVDEDEDGAPDPTSIEIIEYLTSDFTISGTQVKPEEEADPVPVKKAVVPEALTTLEAEDATYTNVAIWKATFSNLQTLGATNIGYDFTKTDSAVNNGEVIATEFSGDGNVVFVLALHGVSAEEYAKLTFAPYYTVMEVPAN